MEKRLKILVSVLSILVILLFIYLFLMGRKVRVDFDTDGGSVVETMIIKKGSTINLENDPVKEGYIFEGWYLDGNPFDMSKGVEENIVLYAVWKKVGSTEDSGAEENIEDMTSDDVMAEEPSKSGESGGSGTTSKPEEPKEPETPGGGLIGN